MLTENDRKFATIVDDNTIIVDFRKNKAQLPTQAGQVRAMGMRHAYDDVDDLRIGDLRASRSIHVYHVQSIAKKVWVASYRSLQPAETQEMVRNYLR